ncbi:myocardial zonula adherens protein-like [Helianthus annuus]|uniref:myocardial zonula adherens protein-like n=1 Tax=Helianthus annuus TaxID=4232 RepID=UPI001652EFE1|nr:myocardial zonula adherens protein-like [Helianthus annuus]
MDSEIYITLNKFENFTGIDGESIEELIKRYIELYWEMVRLKIIKTNEEWVNKLGNALPGDGWRTYLSDLKKIYLDVNLSLFIEKIKEREREFQKISKAEATDKAKFKSEEIVREVEEQVKEISAIKVETKAEAKKRAAKELKKVKVESVTGTMKNEQSKEVNVVERNGEVEKVIEVEKIVEVIKSCLKCSEPCKQCEEKDEKLVEQEKMIEKLLFDLNYVKESYDVLNRTVLDTDEESESKFESESPGSSSVGSPKTSVKRVYKIMSPVPKYKHLSGHQKRKRKKLEEEKRKADEVKQNRIHKELIESFASKNARRTTLFA